ncbi:MAG: hypothetical protein NTW72_02150 [Gemmatimonadetes bacterium]|nr:hypothetical protein [Gemmatimonadota bacterium]
MIGRTRAVAFVACVIACLVACATAAEAQSNCTSSSSIRTGSAARTCTFTISAANASTYTNPKILLLTASTTAVALTIDEAAFVAGKTPESSMTLVVKGNRSWSVTAQGGLATFNATGTLAWSSKPVTDIKWATTSGAAGTSLTTTAVTVMTGNATASSSATLYWSSALSWTTDKPGTYSMPINITLTTP